MVLKDWKNMGKLFPLKYSVVTWYNEGSDSAIDVLTGRHKWGAISSHEENWIKRISSKGYQVSVIAEVRYTNGGYPKITRYFRTKKQALAYAESYMKKH